MQCNYETLGALSKKIHSSLIICVGSSLQVMMLEYKDIGRKNLETPYINQ